MNSKSPTFLHSSGQGFGVLMRRMKWLGLVICALVGSGAGDQEARVLEYEVKAAFLVKFGMFVEWSTNLPATAAQGGFTIGILGKDPFGQNFDEAVKKIKIKECPVRILRGQTPGELAECQMVFICASEAMRLGELIRALSSREILTVADDPDFVCRGGMIGFIKDEGRVRFEINLAAAEKSGLKISSKLLQVSKRVAGKNPTS
jgi:hypothetical protein